MSVTASTPLWIAARTLLADHVDDFFAHWEKTAETFEEEEVHDFRVASRRLREALALFSPCLPDQKSRKAAKQVKKVTRLLGDLRNTDEAFRFFSELSHQEREGSVDEVDQILTALRREREEAHQRLREELSSLDPEPLQRKLKKIQDRPELFASSGTDPFMAMSLFAGGAIMERAESVAELLPEALKEQNDAAQHRLRIAVKRLRYRIEILEPLIREGYQDLRAVLKGYQDVLGKLHDLDVFRTLVRERVAEGAGKEHLLRVMAARRKALYKEFLKLLKKNPVDKVGERAKDAL